MASGVLSQEFLEHRIQAKSLFKQGKVQDSFEYLEAELLNKAKERLADHSQKSSIFEVIESLILIARLKMEIGEFPKAESALEEVK
jgi:hypothetical protein